MIECISIILRTAIGTVAFLSCVLIAMCCFKRSRRMQTVSKRPMTKEEKAAHLSSMTHSRQCRSQSFISHDYHHNMTLPASTRRIEVILEQQQQTSTRSSPVVQF